MNILKLFFIVFLLALTNCTTPIEIDTVNTNLTTAPAVDPDPISTSPITWHIYTTEQLKSLSKTPNSIFYTLDSENFNTLTIILGETNRFIEQQNQVLNYYKSSQ